MKRITIITVLIVSLFALPGYAAAAEVDEQAEEQTQAEQVQTINAYDGVYEYGGRVETYYSSNVAYHYRTPEWTVDEQGFYRTSEGYYVVAASDYEQGELIETSMGTAQVLDSGCDVGITDFYTAW